MTKIFTFIPELNHWSIPSKKGLKDGFQNKDEILNGKQLFKRGTPGVQHDFGIANTMQI